MERESLASISSNRVQGGVVISEINRSFMLYSELADLVCSKLSVLVLAARCIDNKT